MEVFFRLGTSSYSQDYSSLADPVQSKSSESAKTNTVQLIYDIWIHGVTHSITVYIMERSISIDKHGYVFSNSKVAEKLSNQSRLMFLVSL